MIQLRPKILQPTINGKLNELQQKIDVLTTFNKRSKKAQSLWSSKGGKKGKDAFEIIKKELYEMTVFEGICNYCEQSEANDIEHINPKSFFPQHTFSWTNYILACKQCNSGFKLDKCNVLDNNGDIHKTVRGNEPLFNQIAFLNPRLDNISDFIMLNPYSFKFELMPGLDNSSINKANSTLEILQLNNRQLLIEARRSAAIHYYEMLERLVKILRTRSKLTLKKQLTPYDDLFDFTKSLDDLKKEIKEARRQYISTYQHPSVWYTIKVVMSKTDDKWKKLFKSIPDLDTW